MIWGDQGEIDYVQYDPDGSIKYSEVLFKTDYDYGSDPNAHFLFYISCSKDEFKRGNEFTAEIEMVNNSGKPYVFEGQESLFRPEVTLYHTDNGKEYVIPYEPVPDTGNSGRYEMAPGELRSYTFRFNIPEDAPTGEYNLNVLYENSSNYDFGIFVID